MELYKSVDEYSKSQGIHRQTGVNRLSNGRLIKLTLKGKKVGYIDKLVIVKEFINQL